MPLPHLHLRRYQNHHEDNSAIKRKRHCIRRGLIHLFFPSSIIKHPNMMFSKNRTHKAKGMMMMYLIQFIKVSIITHLYHPLPISTHASPFLLLFIGRLPFVSSVSQKRTNTQSSSPSVYILSIGHSLAVQPIQKVHPPSFEACHG